MTNLNIKTNLIKQIANVCNTLCIVNIGRYIKELQQCGRHVKRFETSQHINNFYTNSD